MSQLSLSLDTPLMVRDGRGRYRPADADQILEAARQVIEQKMQRGAEFTSPVVVKDYLRAKLAGFEHEVFAVLFLDTRHRLIDYVEMFHGTIDAAEVHPREVVKLALRLNALKSRDLKVNPAKIDGGGPNNVVPDQAILRVNMRPMTPDGSPVIGATGVPGGGSWRKASSSS